MSKHNPNEHRPGRKGDPPAMWTEPARTAEESTLDVRERELRHMAAQLNEAHRLLRNWLVEGQLAKLPVPMLMSDTEEALASARVKQTPQREEWPSHCGQPARPAKDVPGFVCMECSAVFQVRR